MLLLLHPHPSNRGEDVHRISVEVGRTSDGLRLRYTLDGRLDRLALPPPGPLRRSEGLWRHSCFEAFIRAGGGPEYVELNFAPSGGWSAYEFESERDGMTEAEIELRRLESWSDSHRLQLIAEIRGLAAAEPWRLGLSAVIEDVSGSLSYWALVHLSEEPDFHHPGSFILALP